jgi:hypothetical protein
VWQSLARSSCRLAFDRNPAHPSEKLSRQIVKIDRLTLQLNPAL